MIYSSSLGTFTTDTSGQLDVLGHDGDTLGVDGAQVGVFEQTNQVSLRGFLKGHDSRGLETEISLEVLGDFTDQALERQLPDEELSALLVTTDLTESHGSWPVTVGFLDASCGRGGFASSLGGELLAWGLASSGFTGGLLGTSHVDNQTRCVSPAFSSKPSLYTPDRCGSTPTAIGRHWLPYLRERTQSLTVEAWLILPCAAIQTSNPLDFFLIANQRGKN